MPFWTVTVEGHGTVYEGCSVRAASLRYQEAAYKAQHKDGPKAELIRDREVVASTDA